MQHSKPSGITILKYIISVILTNLERYFIESSSCKSFCKCIICALNLAAARMIVAAVHTERYKTAKIPCTFSSGLLFLHSVLITGTLASFELSTQQQPTLSSATLGTLARFRIRGAASEPAIVCCSLAFAFKPHLLLERIDYDTPPRN